jgi:hypothetical protein
MFVVFDLDGTIADCDHRLHHIQLPAAHDAEWPEQNWDTFYAACDGDTPIWPIQAVAVAMIDQGHRVEFWTGRSDQCRAQTERWLFENGFAGIPVRMRVGGDRTADHRLKATWLAEHGRPDLIFEDRAAVVAMWRSHGIVCCQVAPGEF